MSPQENNSKKPAAPHTLPVFDDQKVEMHTMQQDIQKTKQKTEPEEKMEETEKNLTDMESKEKKADIPEPPKAPEKDTPFIKGSLKIPEKKTSPFDRFKKAKNTEESSPPNISKFKEMLPKTAAKEETEVRTENKNTVEKKEMKGLNAPAENETKTPGNKNNLEIKIPGEKSKLPTLIILAASLVVLVAGGGLWYYLFFIKDTPSQAPVQTETEQPPVIKIPEPEPKEIVTPKAAPKIEEKKELPEPQIPSSSIVFDQTVISTVNQKNSAELIQNLKRDISQIAGGGLVARHLFKISNPQEKSFISTSDFLKTIGVFVPSSLMSEMNSIEFVSYKIDSKVRYGFIANISNKQSVFKEMKKWEPEIINNLKQLFMGEPIVVPENPNFSENEYLDFTKRYINLSSTDLSLDYAVSDSFLIVATSKDMMYALILQTQK